MFAVLTESAASFCITCYGPLVAVAGAAQIPVEAGMGAKPEVIRRILRRKVQHQDKS